MSESDEGPGESPEQNPFAGLFGAGLPGGLGGLPDLGAALHRLGDLLSGAQGPVNWKLAQETARTVAGSSDPGTTTEDTDRTAAAMSLADVWIDPVTALPSGVQAVEAWSRRRWVEATLPAWQELVDPVATRVVDAMGDALPEEMRGAAGPLLGVFRQVGGLMFGGQVGQAIGQLATEVLSSTDVGLPLGPAGRAALLPANQGSVVLGLDIADDQARLYLALREAAHLRLFGHVPWLRGHLFDAVAAYARGITIDVSAIESAVRDINPTDPESLQQALSGGLFAPQTTEAQKSALRRLETSLALVEGWVDDVVATAAAGRLPAADRLRETLRRRRAAGGPAEQTFASLVGLELRPRRLREAAALWQAVGEARGAEGRDAVWAHPDLMPTPDDLDDPAGYAQRPELGSADLDLSALTGTDAPHEPPSDERGGESGEDPHAPGEQPPAG